MLFIKDKNPVWGAGQIHFWKTTGDVYCTTPSGGPQWKGPFHGREGKFSCDGRGVGEHECGKQDGWILLNHGATYNYDGSHPCKVIGATNTDGGKGDLTHLFRCVR